MNGTVGLWRGYGLKEVNKTTFESQQLVAVALSPNKKENPMKNVFLHLDLLAAGILPFTSIESRSRWRSTTIGILLLVMGLTTLRLNAQTAVVLDTVFTPPGYDQGPLTASVFIPNIPNGVGVVSAHGSGGVRRGLSIWCDTLAAHGYTAMTIDYYDMTNAEWGFYRYAERTFKAAVQFLRRNAARFKITTGKIAGLGQSEGAFHWGECMIWDNDHMFFQTDQNVSDHLDAAVLLYGVYDTQNFLSVGNLDGDLTTFFREDPSLRATKGNCIANVGNITTPLLLFHGTGDVMVDIRQSIELRDSLVARRRSCQLVTDNWSHVFDVNNLGEFTPAGIVAKDLTLAFLKNTVLTTGVAHGPLSGGSPTFWLAQNYPNPFNPTTTIRYGLPHKSQVSLMVYNILGQLVSQLVNGEQEAGYHEVNFEGSGLASGMYFYRLQAGDFVAGKKLMLIK